MRRIIALGLLILTFLSIVVATASATASKPYSSYDAWFQSDTQGCAGIYKCDCSPVDNYLYASAKAQYLDSNGNYKWTKSVTQKGNDVSQQAFVVYSPNGQKLCYIEANFKAKCGSGTVKSYSDFAKR